VKHREILKQLGVEAYNYCAVICAQLH